MTRAKYRDSVPVPGVTWTLPSALDCLNLSTDSEPDIKSSRTDHLQSMPISDGALDSAVKRWEDAQDLLASALTEYLDSVISMEAVLYTGYGRTSANNLATRIESTLDSLQRDMTRQLGQSTSILAQTRNRLVSPVWHLPETVLSEIFLYIVYAPENKQLSMKNCLDALYSNLHNIMGVCSIWRNVAQNQSILWEIIPACDNPIKNRAIDLSIQRSGDRGSYLATILPKIWGGMPPHLSRILVNHASRLRALNVEGEHLGVISDTITQLLQVGVSKQFSELSISFAPTNYLPSEQKTAEVIHSESPNQANFLRLMESLSVLRLNWVQVHWENTVFSDRLVELSIHRVKLGESDWAMVTFLTAVSSAIELRDLKLVEVKAGRDLTETKGVAIMPKVVFPKLRSLLIHDLRFNVLDFFLHTISPGSYHVTLGLTENAITITYLNHTYDIVEIEELTALLSLVKIDTLLLDSESSLFEPWLDGSGVRKVVASTRGLNVLEMNSWVFDADFCNGLCPHPISDTERGKPSFPKLESWELSRIRISDETAFKNVLANVPAQSMVLGGYIGGEDDPAEIKEGEELVDFLKDSVPNFRLVDSRYIPAGLKACKWLLW